MKAKNLKELKYLNLYRAFHMNYITIGQYIELLTKLNEGK